VSAGLAAAVSYGADPWRVAPHQRQQCGSMVGRPPPEEAVAGAGASRVAGPGSLPRSLSTVAWIQGREGGHGSRAGKAAAPSLSTVV
jgi:hypothetical protein